MAPQEKSKRRRNFVDRAVQGALLLHVVGDWLMFLFTAAIFLLLIEMLTGEPRDAWQAMLRRHGPTMWVALILAPIFIYDLFKLTNRFAGPMVRLRREMRNLAEGREVSPIRFRDGDFWQDMAADFNRVVQRVQTLNAAVQKTEQNVSETEEPEAALAADSHG
jgi:methyl-accepting chemotaxis protein